MKVMENGKGWCGFRRCNNIKFIMSVMKKMLIHIKYIEDI